MMVIVTHLVFKLGVIVRRPTVTHGAVYIKALCLSALSYKLRQGRCKKDFLKKKNVFRDQKVCIIQENYLCAFQIDMCKSHVCLFVCFFFCSAQEIGYHFHTVSFL